LKILVVTSCTGEKKHSNHPRLLTREDFECLNAPEFVNRERELFGYNCRAEELYTGQQHLRLMRGVKTFREKFGSDSISLHILSAGYGVVSGEQKIAPYECTFQGMKAKELRSWSDRLNVPQSIREVLAQPYDLGLVLLGDSYLKACDLDVSVNFGGPTILFCGSTILSKLPTLSGLRKVALTNQEAKRFSCGLVGLKGELAKRTLLSFNGVASSLTSQPDILDFLETVA